jgi:hypothetical protein
MRKSAVGMAGVVGGHALGAAGVAGAMSVGGGHDALRRLGLVYLSHVNDPATTSLFPGDPAFTLEVIATIPADGFYMQFVREGEHTGTTGAPRDTSRRADCSPTSSTRATCSSRR